MSIKWIAFQINIVQHVVPDRFAVVPAEPVSEVVAATTVLCLARNGLHRPVVGANSQVPAADARLTIGDWSGQVRVYQNNGTALTTFTAYPGGQVRLAVKDLDFSGLAEILTGPSTGRPAETLVFDGDGTQLDSFFAFGSTYEKGIFVA